MKVWDSAGMERFKTLTKSFYRKADAILIVFTLGERKSFENVQNWIESVEQNSRPNMPIVLVGSKIDIDYERAVSKEEAQHFADKLDI